MKRRSIALSAAVALLSMVITSCADFNSGNSNIGEMPTSSSTTETSETYAVITDVISTTTSVWTTTMAPTTYTEPATTQIETTTTTQAPIQTETSTTTLSTSQEPTLEVTTTSDTMTNPPMPTEPAVTSTTTTTTTAVVTEAPVIPDVPQTGFQELPAELMQIVQKYQRKYPNMAIGVGIYSMDGLSGHEYNASQLFNGACTIKASYGLFVCDYCDKNNIDIWSEKLYYDTSKHHHGGSGVIYKKGNGWYSIGELLTYLLQVSDNDAMKLLITRFSMSDYYNFIIPLGGESDWANWNGGRASVQQRRNEWLAIYNYVNSDARNAKNLRTFITNSEYCYLVKGMTYIPTYMHKSGWCDSYSYPAAADAAIIENRTGTYLMVVMTQDYSTGNGHTDAIAELGNAIDDYFYKPGFFW